MAKFPEALTAAPTTNDHADAPCLLLERYGVTQDDLKRRKFHRVLAVGVIRDFYESTQMEDPLRAARDAIVEAQESLRVAVEKLEQIGSRVDGWKNKIVAASTAVHEPLPSIEDALRQFETKRPKGKGPGGAGIKIHRKNAIRQVYAMMAVANRGLDIAHLGPKAKSVLQCLQKSSLPEAAAEYAAAVVYRLRLEGSRPWKKLRKEFLYAVKTIPLH